MSTSRKRFRSAVPDQVERHKRDSKPSAELSACSNVDTNDSSGVLARDTETLDAALKAARSRARLVASALQKCVESEARVRTERESRQSSADAVDVDEDMKVAESLWRAWNDAYSTLHPHVHRTCESHAVRADDIILALERIQGDLMAGEGRVSVADAVAAAVAKEDVSADCDALAAQLDTLCALEFAVRSVFVCLYFSCNSAMFHAHSNAISPRFSDYAGSGRLSCRDQYVAV